MKDGKPERKPHKGPWSRPVEFGVDGSGRPFAFVPDQVVVRIPNRAVEERVRSEMVSRVGGLREWIPGTRFGIIEGVDDVMLEAEFWNRLGIASQPNHVMFATAGEASGNPAASAASMFATGATFGNPSAAGATFGNPWAAGATFGNPWAAGATFGNPWAAGATFGNPFGAHGGCVPCCPPHAAGPAHPPMSPGEPRRNLAVPTKGLNPRPALKALRPCRVVVLDTGLGAGGYLPTDFAEATSIHVVTETEPKRPATDEPDETGDKILDPVAGHGTFIAGLVKRIAPEATVEVVRVLSTMGDGDDGDIATAIEKLCNDHGDPDILSLSFSGYTDNDRPPIALADVLDRFQDRGGVVVASAGNDATARPAFPAALPNVVSVAALGPNGPAPFTNYGMWVRACAPGVDVVSRFYAHRPGSSSGNMVAIKNYKGWASWSGTSFSAPIVAGVLARTVSRGDLSPEEAVARCIDDPRLLRIPGLGTVINEH